MNVIQRIAALRDQMKQHQIDAYLITGTDPHLSEYTPDPWKTREWISGFTGSYGKVLITKDKILLWTDTRYFIQAIEEINGTGIELMKERVLDAIPLEEWLLNNMDSGQKFAVNGATLAANDAIQLTLKLNAKGVTLVSDLDLVQSIWKNRPNISAAKIYEHTTEFAGKSRSDKIKAVRQMLASMDLDSTIITMLDEIAWLFNIRSNEIQYTPLVTAYGYVDHQNCCLFIQPDQISNRLREILEKEKIVIYSYDQFLPFISRITEKRIQIDPNRTNYWITKLISTSNVVESVVSIVTQIKAIKDQTEISHIRNAHFKDGAAMVNSLYWIIQNIGKEHITETIVGIKLNEFRKKQPHFKGDSFHPIVGYGSHGAIVHYHATIQTEFEIFPGNLLLIDSGGQYLDGTTDITRTISLGTPSERQKEDFTLCLKAHIALATAVFPLGTKGYSLDSIARKPLWDKGINYGHGTGHGIGYFLSVHEGPMSIRAEFNNEPIREGHLLSNEPGIYREGEYGIRIENVILCQQHSSNQFGDFLCFETLSFCPIDKNLIDNKLLTTSEISWINQYHDSVFRNISPMISEPKVYEWLKIQCEPIYEP